MLLEIKNLKAGYSNVEVLGGISLTLEEGEIVGLIGPNGAGKSTILKSVFSLVQKTGGQIYWRGEDITNLPTHVLLGKGIGFVPQGRLVFPTLTVLENLEMGGYILEHKETLARNLEFAFRHFLVLRRKAKTLAGLLSGGEQQMLAIARGLMTTPKLLMLDEPSLGLAPKIVKEVFSKINEINEKHKTAILVVEHNIKSLLQIAGRVYVLDKGKVVAAGTAKKIAESDILERVFLGQ